MLIGGCGVVCCPGVDGKEILSRFKEPGCSDTAKEVSLKEENMCRTHGNCHGQENKYEAKVSMNDKNFSKQQVKDDRQTYVTVILLNSMRV